MERQGTGRERERGGEGKGPLCKAGFCFLREQTSFFVIKSLEWHQQTLGPPLQHSSTQTSVSVHALTPSHTDS